MSIVTTASASLQQQQQQQQQPRFVVVLDFEANCSASQTRDHEIIEFPAVLIDCAQQKAVDEFHHYVQLVKTERVSEFIKNLTHITDAQVQSGTIWSECLAAFEQWLRAAIIERHCENIGDVVVLCCGSWDIKTMLPRQLEITATQLTPMLAHLFARWHNIKKSFVKHFNEGRQQGMDGMLKHFNMTLDGHHHSGIDDTRNISKLALHWLSNGISLQPNCLHDAQSPFYRFVPDGIIYERNKQGRIVYKH